MKSDKPKRRKDNQQKETTKSKTQKENQTNMTTLREDDIDLGDAEDFKLPSVGIHDGNLAGVELTVTKKNENKNQFILSIVLSSEDPDAPNLPMRLYLGWPLTGKAAKDAGVQDEKDVMWGSRTAYGAQIKSVKDAMTAFGGQESGITNKQTVLAFFNEKIGMACKVKVKQEFRTDPITKKPVEPNEMQASIDRLLPA